MLWKGWPRRSLTVPTVVCETFGDDNLIHMQMLNQVRAVANDGARNHGIEIRGHEAQKSASGR